MSREAAIPIVHVSGSQRDMGRSLGRRCSKIAGSMVRAAESAMNRKGVSWDEAVASAQDYLPYAQEYDPIYLDFMQGYARGSGVSFKELFTLLCQEEKGLCTDVAVNSDATSDCSVFSAHTEDWKPADEEHVVLVHGEPREGPSFLVVTLGGLELVTGLNSAGISFSGNSLEQNDMRIGVPKMFLSRRILAARRIEEAILAAAPPDRASSYNNNICHSSGEMYCIEGSATDFSLLYPRGGYLVHTNHYLDEKMKKFEALFSGPGGASLERGSSSVVRYNRATTLVRRNLGRITVETLTNILSDHVNRPDSICSHEDFKIPPHTRYKTIYAVISDLTNLEMHVCLGNPCEGNWQTHRLR